ncbi:hypothetical protein N2152v2_010067 [Parachlorella kessleri]
MRSRLGLLALLGLAHLAAAQLLPRPTPVNTSSVQEAVEGSLDGQGTPFQSLFIPPPSPSPASASGAPKKCVPVLDLAAQAGNFTALIASSQAVGLDKYLDSPATLCPSGCTLFAPTDEAFNQLLDDQRTSVSDFLDKKDDLAEILSYHILPQLLFTGQMRDSQELNTLLTAAVQLNRGSKYPSSSAKKASMLRLGKQHAVNKLLGNSSDIITVIPSGGPSAKIVRGDVPACYFIVQVVDKVLLPDLGAINGTGGMDSNKGSIGGTPGASMPYTVDASS